MKKLLNFEETFYVMKVFGKIYFIQFFELLGIKRRYA